MLRPTAQRRRELNRPGKRNGERIFHQRGDEVSDLKGGPANKAGEIAVQRRYAKGKWIIEDNKGLGIGKTAKKREEVLQNMGEQTKIPTVHKGTESE